MIARGFPSETFLWRSAKEINWLGDYTVIYQLGDHDPSGVLGLEPDPVEAAGDG